MMKVHVVVRCPRICANCFYAKNNIIGFSSWQSLSRTKYKKCVIKILCYVLQPDLSFREQDETSGWCVLMMYLTRQKKCPRNEKNNNNNIE